MDYKNSQKSKIICKKSFVRDINKSIFEKLPYDIITYITHFLQIVDIINLPILSKHFQDDIQKKYLMIPYSELYLRFNYGFRILDPNFLFLEMENYSNENCLKKKIETNLLNDFIQILSMMCKNLIKDKKFTEKKVEIFCAFLLDLMKFDKNRKRRFLIGSTIMEYIVQCISLLEEKEELSDTVFNKCLEFSIQLKDEKQMGINSFMNLLENSKTSEILEKRFYYNIISDFGKICKIFPIKYLEKITNFILHVKKKRFIEK